MYIILKNRTIRIFHFYDWNENTFFSYMLNLFINLISYFYKIGEYIIFLYYYRL